MQGINMEGPYISREKCGAQNPAFLRPADPDEVLALDAISPIRLVDLAPEAEGALTLPRALGGKIVCSVAHTNATYAETKAAFQAGFSHVTHLFNAMSPFSHRAPGAVGAALENDRVTAELICDGFHLDPVTVRLAFRLLGANRCVAISDSLSCAGCPDGDGYALGGQQVFVKDGKAFLKNGTIAGSTTNLLQGFRNLLRFGVPFTDALAACTINPARVIGADRDTGSIEEGKFADLIFVDDSMNLKHVMVKGKMIF
jgi:N-acetylglucosamine-6-phosphate deacetylase